jgi:Uma2 family endonuclease
MAIIADPHELHRLSLEQYHGLIESGSLGEDDRIELLDGLLVSMSPKTREHERAVRYLSRWLSRSLEIATHEVVAGVPLTIGNSEPEPDLMVLPVDVEEPYHPGWALLVIEVAVSSQRRDLLAKPGLYAEAGIPHYWVADLPGRRLICFTEPADGVYTRRRTIEEGEQATLDALPVTPLDVRALLAAAFA